LKQKIKIDKMAALAKIFAPVEALHAKERLHAIKEQDMQLLDQILKDLNY